MVGLCRSARSPCGPCYTGHVRPGLHVPRACKGMVLWPPTGTILPSETVSAPPSPADSTTAAFYFRSKTTDLRLHVIISLPPKVKGAPRPRRLKHISLGPPVPGWISRLPGRKPGALPADVLCVLEGWEQAKVATLGRPGRHVCPGYGVAASRPCLQGCRSWGHLPLEAGTCLSQRSDGGSEPVSGTPCQIAFDFLLCSLGCCASSLCRWDCVAVLGLVSESRKALGLC